MKKTGQQTPKALNLLHSYYSFLGNCDGRWRETAQVFVFLAHFKVFPNHRQIGKVISPLKEILVLCMAAAWWGLRQMWQCQYRTYVAEERMPAFYGNPTIGPDR